VTDLVTRYSQMIEDLINETLKGKIRGGFQIYDRIVGEFETGSDAVFEECLAERAGLIAVNLDSTDDLKQAKAIRQQRALKTIQLEWQKFQAEQLRTGAIASALSQILNAVPDDRLMAWLNTFDPNHQNRLTLDQQQELATRLMGMAGADVGLEAIGSGIPLGLRSWRNLELNLVQWMFDRSSSLGFGNEAVGPWRLWAKEVGSAVPGALFEILGRREVSFEDWKVTVNDRDWVELVIVLLTCQRGLVAWAETQPYTSKGGRELCISTFLSFIVLWSQLSSHFAVLRPSLQGVSFQVVMQLLRSFSQKSYFPFYGGMVAMLSQGSLNDLLIYLDEPLRQVPQTQEKARVLTLIGYSQQVIQNTKGAISFHEEALEIARSAEDHLCSIANLNHLSRTYAILKDYDQSISYAQQALIFARQVGDSLGQANALANVGYGEILRSRQLDRLDEESAEIPISQLMQGLQLASGQDDDRWSVADHRASQALCHNSLGIAYVMIDQPDRALPYLVQGLQAARESGDRYLQGMNLTYFSAAQSALGKVEEAMLSAILGMYILEQIEASEWQQSRNDLLILRGRLGLEVFDAQVQALRSQVIRSIGVDGFDHVLMLLE
jgi:tetratricopeptide (TPR) repeat protein